MDKRTVFIVDDDPAFVDIIGAVLEDDFHIESMSTGRATLDKIAEITPNIVLLDVGLPDLDGYQVCREIKANDVDDAISVMFISGKDSVEDRLAGYTAGADDYLVKPFHIDELHAKVRAIDKFQQGKESLKVQERFSRKMAFQAMGEAAQYGSVLQFFKKASLCTTYPQIAQAVIDLCREFSLSASVEIRAGERLTLRSSGGACSPIEQQLFEMLCSRGRVYQFHQRYMFNDRHISILINDMPIADESSVGRLNDLLATIVEAAESAVVGLSRLTTLKQLLDTTQATVAAVSATYSEHKTKTTSLMDQMISQMEYALGGLGLTETQENFFIELAESTLASLIELHGEAYLIEDKLRKIVNQIKTSLDKG